MQKLPAIIPAPLECRARDEAPFVLTPQTRIDADAESAGPARWFATWLGLEKNQIALSMKKEASASAGPRPAGASAGSGPRPGGGGRGFTPPPPKMQELRNNAFAGLANLKLKK